MRIFALMAALAASLSIALGTASARQLALVIGNDGYEHIEPLRKAVADARGYAAALREKGYQVTQHENLRRSDLDSAIATFVEEIRAGDTAVFVFSGHGWSDGTQNYIVATDAPARASPELLARLSFPLRNGSNGVLDDIERKGASLKIAIIDACRNNPFASSPGQRAFGLARGLAAMQVPRGTFVVFSAAAGQTALDRLSENDGDPNSVFTRVFLPLLRADLSLQESIKIAQERVGELARQSHSEQKPAYYDEVDGAACLSGSCKNGTGAVVVINAPVPQPVALLSPVERPDEAAWALIQNSNDQTMIVAFINRFPASPLRERAEARLSILRAQPNQQFQASTPQLAGPSKSFVRPDWCNNTRPKNAVETTICADAELARLDIQLNDLYRARYAASAGARRSSLVRDTRDWIALRNSRCGATAPSARQACIRDFLENRIATLEGTITSVAAAPAASAARPSWCRNANGKNLVETTICTDDQLSRLDNKLNDLYRTQLGSLGGSRRGQLVSDSRRWIAVRNATCRVAANPKSCLFGMMQDRIARLQDY